MSRLINRLTPRFVAQTTLVGRHADGGNLYLIVDPSGAKRWIFLFRWRGRNREMGLGSIRSVSLAQARQAAMEARQTIACDKDPIEERRRGRRQVPLFGAFADEFVEAQAPGWRNAKHFSQWRNSVQTDAKRLRQLPIDQIMTDDVLAVLKPIWAKKPETAKRTRGRIERILDAAKARGLRSGENPARWKGHLSLMLPKPPRLVRGHLPAMPIDKLPEFMLALDKRPASAARALEFAILTGARTNEVLGARWSEIDLDNGIWVVPAERVKTGVDHRVPLSSQAIAVINGVRSNYAAHYGRSPADADFVFLRGRTAERLSNMAMEMLLRRMEIADACVHGFRSTFRDWAGERTEFPRELIEMSLSHLVGSEVERAYRRGDALERRRVLMTAWADFCMPPPTAYLKAA
jgi:integrase